jgi:hypothetical protein
VNVAGLDAGNLSAAAEIAPRSRTGTRATATLSAGARVDRPDVSIRSDLTAHANVRSRFSRRTGQDQTSRAQAAAILSTQGVARDVPIPGLTLESTAATSIGATYRRHPHPARWATQPPSTSHVTTLRRSDPPARDDGRFEEVDSEAENEDAGERTDRERRDAGSRRR